MEAIVNMQGLQPKLASHALLAHIKNYIHQSLELSEVLTATAVEVRAFLGTDRVLIYQFHCDRSGEVVTESIQDQRLPTLLNSSSLDDTLFCLSEFLTPNQRLMVDVASQQIKISPLSYLETGDPLATVQTYYRSADASHIESLKAMGVQASLVVPIVYRDRTPNTNLVLWGLLVSHHGEPHTPSETDLQVIQQAIDYVSIAISQASLLEQIRSQAQRENALMQQSWKADRVLKQVTNQIRRTLDLQTILQTIAQEVLTLLETDRVVIYQFTRLWQGEIVVEATVGSWMPLLGQVYKDECFPQKHAQNYQKGRIRAIDDVIHSDLNPCHIQFLLDLQVQANLVVPIRNGTELWGLLIAHECKAPRAWQGVEIDLLQQLADQAAIAIHQAELYQRSQQATATATAQAQQLEQALQELKQTQTQLIQTEKMSGLGQLVAGVAHEINNPVSFIYGNLPHAQIYVQELLNLLRLYQRHYPQPHPEIGAHVEALDLDFLTEDLLKLLTSIRTGSDRIRQIVLSLRNFSRLDQAEMKPVNLHEGIDNTLLILQHRLKLNADRPAIQIIKEYGNLPDVECYAGQLNQVWMNILSNAIEALEEAMGSGQWTTSNEQDGSRLLTAAPLLPTITIRTQLVDSDRVQIRIADNGPGMPEAVKARIFDPFFTTKDVGKGTGLGLSISYQIVEKHQGQIQCVSQLNQGTEFWIEIPLCTV
jgi:signal transduction histidine kinase